MQIKYPDKGMKVDLSIVRGDKAIDIKQIKSVLKETMMDLSYDRKIQFASLFYAINYDDEEPSVDDEKLLKSKDNIHSFVTGLLIGKYLKNTKATLESILYRLDEDE